MTRRLVLLIFSLACAVVAGCQTVDSRLAAGIRQGDRNYRQGNLIGAERALTAALRVNSQCPAAAEAFYIRALTRLKQGNVRGAEADLICAVELAERMDLKTNCQVCLGSIAYERQNFRRAYEHYRQACDDLARVSPNDRVLYRLGVSAQKIGKWRQASRYLGRVIRDYPRTASARLAKKLVRYEFYTIQAGAFRRPMGASARVASLRKAGLPGRCEQKSSGGQALRIVYVGRYKDFKSASESLDKVKRIVPDARIVP